MTYAELLLDSSINNSGDGSAKDAINNIRITREVFNVLNVNVSTSAIQANIRNSKTESNLLTKKIKVNFITKKVESNIQNNIEVAI